MRPRERQVVNAKCSSANRCGFTLIELLVVLAIIALLMAMLVPVLGRVRRQAKALRCGANLQQWGRILALYVEDNEGHLPQSRTGAMWLLRGLAPSEDHPRKPDVYSPVYTEGIACCPMAVRPARQTRQTITESTEGLFGPWSVRYMHGGPFDAWEITSPGPPFCGSYGFNQWLLEPLFGFFGRTKWLGPDLFSLRRKPDIPVLLDCPVPYAWPRAQHIPPPELSAVGVSEMARFCVDRHDAQTNGLFLDWSVRQIGLKELWTLRWHRDFNTAGHWTKAGGILPDDWPPWMRRFKDY